MKWIERADLPAAEEVEQPRPGRVHRRRHGEPGQDHQRQQPEEHAEIGELLQARCSACRLACRKAQPRVVLDVRQRCARPELAPARHEVAPEVAVRKAPRRVGGSPTASTQAKVRCQRRAEREVVARGDRRPAGKGPASGLALHRSGAEHPGRVEARPADAEVAGPVGAADLEPGRIGVGPVVRPSRAAGGR